uniref:AlNc14C88G5595 protein n=1 Tax=Albugo laibachii Nc14 TaxID=890382 RepID=F0WG65_9STRA|nr:AlNc14C88G5595 [Albugo laibachii Nc14]|eukprot:CCA20200.1 AlNc14C88G5595 [Albugo laibachii Nc14]
MFGVTTGAERNTSNPPTSMDMSPDLIALVPILTDLFDLNRKIANFNISGGRGTRARKQICEGVSRAIDGDHDLDEKYAQEASFQQGQVPPQLTRHSLDSH